jgi:hypothetical protein
MKIALAAVLLPAWGLTVAGQSQTAQNAAAAAVLPASPSTCNPWVIQSLPSELSFRQRFCLQLAHLASPATLFQATAAAGFSQWRNKPAISPHDADDFSVRLGHSYEQQAARATAELFVGYFHHEDLRFHPSHKASPWQRTRAAFLSVMVSPDSDGNARVAFAPMAGALGWGLTSMALYQQRNSLAYGIERSGVSYSAYFARALFHEFSPELWSLTPRFIRKHRETVGRAFTL